jgi:hypothetical protein
MGQDGRTDIQKLIVLFCNSANAPKNEITLQQFSTIEKVLMELVTKQMDVNK